MCGSENAWRLTDSANPGTRLLLVVAHAHGDVGVLRHVRDVHSIDADLDARHSLSGVVRSHRAVGGMA